MMPRRCRQPEFVGRQEKPCPDHGAAHICASMKGHYGQHHCLCGFAWENVRRAAHSNSYSQEDGS